MGEMPAETRFGDYTLGDELGRGGSGIVYRTEHPRHGRVALKILRGAGATPEASERFLRAAQTARALEHPHIARIVETGTIAGEPYAAMELVEGESLSAWGRAHRGDHAAVASLLSQMAGALEAAHDAGVIHRDVKPGNILVECSTHRAVLLDFGLARALDGSTRATREGTALGTAPYMAPEAAAGHVRDLTERTDIYGLGAVAYEILTGVPPHGGTSEAQVFLSVLSGNLVAPSRLRAGIPEPLEAIVLRMLSHRPSDRYGSAREVLRDLEAFRTGAPVSAVRHLRESRASPRRARLAAGVAGLSIAALLHVAWEHWGRPSPEPAPPDRPRTTDEAEMRSTAQQRYMDGDYEGAREIFERLAACAEGEAALYLRYQAALCILRPAQGPPGAEVLPEARARLEGILAAGARGEILHRTQFWLAILDLHGRDFAGFEKRLQALSTPGAWKEVLAWVPRDLGLRAAEAYFSQLRGEGALRGADLDALEEAGDRYEALGESARACDVRLLMSQVALREGEGQRALAFTQQAAVLVGADLDLAAACAYQEARVFAALGNLDQAEAILHSERIPAEAGPPPAGPQIPSRLPQEAEERYRERVAAWALENQLSLDAYREASRRHRAIRVQALQRDTLLIQVLSARGAHEEALGLARKIVADPEVALLDPALHAEALLRRGEVLQQVSPEEALEAFDEVLAFAQVREAQAQAALSIGRTHWLLDDLASAEAAFTETLERYPEQAPVAAAARVARGMVRYQAGRAQEAFADWRAIRDDPHPWPDTLGEQAALTLLGEAGATPASDALLRRVPLEDRNDVLFWASCRLWMEGDEATAVGLLNRVLDANPLHDWPHPLAGTWMRELGVGAVPAIPRLAPIAPPPQ